MTNNTSYRTDPGMKISVTQQRDPEQPRAAILWACWEFLEGALHFGIALVLLVLSLPVLLLVAIGIKATSRGPILYRQVRLGRNGRPYTLVKFRTMHVDSEKNGACWSLPGDARVTWLGRVLRDTHLDELPQLWNVLRRQMNLIGPRPERPEFVHGLKAVLPRYQERLAVRPGLTGLAQVQQAADTGIDSVRTKLAYDLWYLHRRGPGLDLRILLATGLLLCGVSFVRLRWLCRFPARSMVEQAYFASPRAVESQVPEKSAPQFIPHEPVVERPAAPMLTPKMVLNSPERG